MSHPSRTLTPGKMPLRRSRTAHKLLIAGYSGIHELITQTSPCLQLLVITITSIVHPRDAQSVGALWDSPYCLLAHKASHYIVLPRSPTLRLLEHEHRGPRTFEPRQHWAASRPPRRKNSQANTCVHVWSVARGVAKLRWVLLAHLGGTPWGGTPSISPLRYG